MKEHFTLALSNIARHGDTDIFPFPFENSLFFDTNDAIADLLMKLSGGFDDALANEPPVNVSSLAPSGYAGFRWATQIDPLWNAYLLGLVISIAEPIEQARLPIAMNRVFSYRIALDQEEATLFSKLIGWKQFREASIKNAELTSHVLTCDISDFYGRIYHHRLENALQWLFPKPPPAVRHITRLLQVFSDTKSYGLPVGGPAARILSELLLNATDRLLISKGINFCRYADDYHIFANSIEEAHRALIFISRTLLQNEGLALQKSKTRLCTSAEFLSSIGSGDDDDSADSAASEARRFMSMPIHFDPYSATADADYEALRTELAKFDIVGLLGREVTKSRVHVALTVKLLKAVKHLDADSLSLTARTVLDHFDTLAPVLPSVLMMLREIFDKLDINTKATVAGHLQSLIRSESHLMAIDMNLRYALRVLSKSRSIECEQVCASVHEKTSDPLVRRDVILVMARWHAHYWISNLRSSFRTMSPWERRAYIVSSFCLGDEGRHWRTHIKKELSDFEKQVIGWADGKIGLPGWEVLI